MTRVGIIMKTKTLYFFSMIISPKTLNRGCKRTCPLILDRTRRPVKQLGVVRSGGKLDPPESKENTKKKTKTKTVSELESKQSCFEGQT